MDPGAPDSSLILPLRFQIGERTLATVRRRLLSRSQDLESLLDAADVALPPLPPHADGLLLRSVASDQLGTIEARADDLLLYVRQRYPRHYARLEGSFEEYLAGFSPKSRSTLKRKVRRFEQLSGGRLDVREYRTPVQMETFHALARLVSKKTYQERLLGSGLPDGEAFRAEMLASAAEDNERGYLLFLAGEPVSYLYAPVRQGCVIYSHLGYDPALAAHSPGTVLQLEAMARLFAERHHRFFDFTEGDGQHKRLFATGCVDCADVLLLRPSLSNRVLIATHRNFHLGVEALGNVAERWGVKARLKKWLRGTPTLEATNGGAATAGASETERAPARRPKAGRPARNHGLADEARNADRDL